MSSALLEMRNVTVMRSGRPVLHNLSLDIRDGEHIAILGPNGCGKSTFIKTLTRELYPAYDPATSIRLFGESCWNISELRSMLGIVSNDIDLFLNRPTTGRDAVLSGFFSSVGIASHHSVTAAMRHRADEVLAWLGVSHLSSRIVGEMSSGETRRIMIARALVHQPRALLFDEPSNSLDIFAQRELRESMRQLAQFGLTLLLITHHLADVIPEIDRVLFLRHGRILADGSKRELLTSPQLSALFDCPAEVTERDGYYHLVC